MLDNKGEEAKCYQMKGSVILTDKYNKAKKNHNNNHICSPLVETFDSKKFL